MRHGIAIVWLRWIAAAFVIAVLPQTAQAESPPRETFTSESSIAVPFNLDQTSAAWKRVRSVRLLQSVDGGRHWTVKAEVPPTATEFRSKFDSDGRYDLAVRTVDSAGTMHPTGPVQCEIRMVVDRSAPFLSLELKRESSDAVTAMIRCSDTHLDRKSLTVEAQRSTDSSETFLLKASFTSTTSDEAGLRVKTRWDGLAGQGLTVRVGVRDQAGNRTTRTATSPAKTTKAVSKTIQQVNSEQTIEAADTGAGPVLNVASNEPSEGDRLFVVPRRVDDVVLPPEPTTTPTANTTRTSTPTKLSPVPNAPLPELLPQTPEEPSSPDVVIPSHQLSRWKILQRAARNAVDLGNLPTAISRFREMLDLVPEDHATRFEYAGLLLQTGKTAEAKQEFQRLAHEHSEQPKYQEALADLLIQSQDYEAARNVLRQILLQSGANTPVAVKLAKTYAWERRFEEAADIYDRYLKDISQVAPQGRRELATLLMSMNRNADALDLLLAVRAELSTPAYEPGLTDESILADIILCSVRLMQRELAMTSIDELRQHPLRDSQIWLGLAEQLYREQAFVEALAVFEIVSQTTPESQPARLGAARTHLRLLQVGQARQILDELQGASATPMYSTVEADYFTMVGEWANAVSVATQRLRENPTDLEAGVLLGNAFHTSGQFDRAHAVYTQVLNQCGNDADQQAEIQRLIAANHTLSRRFELAVPILEALLIANPADIASRLQLIRTYVKSKQFGEAERYARLRPDDLDPRHRYALRTELGFVLLERGRYAEAAREFESLLQVGGEITPDAAYGLYRTQQRLGNSHAARAALLLGPTPSAPPAMWAIVIAGRALADCDCPLAMEILDQYLKLSPGHPVALNLRGEAAGQCDCGCGCDDDESGCDRDVCQTDCGGDGAGYFREVLLISPANIRARLGLARSMGRHHEFEAAYAEYEQLLQFDPDNINLRREVGRLVDGWQGIERAGSFYMRPTDAAIELDALFASPANGDGIVVAGGLIGGGLSPGFGTGSASYSGLLTGTSFGDSQSAAADSLLLTEYQAKYHRGWRNRWAIPMYEGLIDMEPTNEEAYFELGQVYASMNRTRCAIDVYDRLQEVNPCHRQARIARERLAWELNPQLRTGFTFGNQDGRNGLTDIRRTVNTVAGHFPIGDENEFFQVGYRHAVLRPTGAAINHGEIGFARLQERLTADWLLFGEIDVEEYDYGFSTRPTFEAGTQYWFNNDLFLQFGGFLNNVIENGESIRQDIFRAGLQLDAGWTIHRDWSLAGLYRWADYSDRNTLNEFSLGGAYRIWEGRKQLRALVDYNFLTFAEQSILQTSLLPPLSGTIHPYFAPQSYSFASAGLEWKHWLSCDTFKGADQKWYQVYLGGRFDSQSEAFFLLRTQLYYDVTSWLTWTVESDFIRSEVYDQSIISTHGVVRFP